MKKTELKLNNVFVDEVCSKTGQYLAPTHIVFEDENGGLVHPWEAAKESISISFETYDIIQKMLSHYEELRILATKEINTEVKTDLPF